MPANTGENNAKMIINPTGYIGIGTTSPAHILDVKQPSATVEPCIKLTQYNGPNYGAGIGTRNITSVAQTLDFYVGGGLVNNMLTTSNIAMTLFDNKNVGFGVTSPQCPIQVANPVDTVYSGNPISNNTVTIFGPARTVPTQSGTSDLNGTLFINSTSPHGLGVGASIALGGRGNNFGGGQNHMTFGRISGVQSYGNSAYYGNLTFETQNSGALYRRMVIDESGGVSINGTLSVSGTKNFDIKHPNTLLNNKRLLHSCIEGPRCDLIYRGTANLINGKAEVNLDSDCVASSDCAMSLGTFELLVNNPQFYLQNPKSFDRLIGEIIGNKLIIECENQNSSAVVNWLVIGERKDTNILESKHTNKNGYLITEYENINGIF